MKHTGVIAIVGRPNVGKSTIFNRLAGSRISIVEDTPGVTRDRIYAKGSWLGREFRVIDTGGIQLEDQPYQEEIRAQVSIAIEEADVIVMVCSGKTGLALPASMSSMPSGSEIRLRFPASMASASAICLMHA